jgi:NRAMP (natural resistance-associated macrophage protein)-like metal ion transporter
VWKRHRPNPAQTSGLLGPGLIAGASDDDPAGIATYSQSGAMFGYGMLWLMPFVWPFMSAIQEIAARIGRTTGHGIAQNLRRHYPKWFSIPIVVLLCAANVLNLGADLGAMGVSLKLMIGGPAQLYVALFAVLSVLGVTLLSYRRYARLLRWLTIFLMAYVGAAMASQVDWSAALRGTLIPSVALEPGYLAMIVAVLGTTISPYVFFWQASEEAEEVRISKPDHALKSHPEEAPAQLRRIRWDTLIGMLFSNATAWFIMLTCASTLHESGVTRIDTAEQAAEALRPLAGQGAFYLFALGIIGTGLLAVPVLAGSAAYAVGEELRQRVGIEYPPKKAPYFYAVFGIATLLGVGISLSGINPMRALVLSAIVNGVVAVPLMAAMLLMVRSERVMGPISHRSPTLIALGWAATLLMAAAAIAMAAVS